MFEFVEEYIDYFYDISDTLKDIINKLKDAMPSIIEKGSGFFPK